LSTASAKHTKFTNTQQIKEIEMSKKSPVKFTKKFQAQARSFYNKIADLPVYEAGTA
jgi:hypothetical protein